MNSPWLKPTPETVLRIKAVRVARQEHAALCAERRFREALIEGLFRQFGPISNEAAVFLVGRAPLQ